jgi:hypothetical protein
VGAERFSHASHGIKILRRSLVQLIWYEAFELGVSKCDHEMEFGVLRYHLV